MRLKVAPIAVYTSGKGSSAAGLTASVQRDAASVRFSQRWCMCINLILCYPPKARILSGRRSYGAG